MFNAVIPTNRCYCMHSIQAYRLNLDEERLNRIWKRSLATFVKAVTMLFVTFSKDLFTINTFEVVPRYLNLINYENH